MHLHYIVLKINFLGLDNTKKSTKERINQQPQAWGSSTESPISHGPMSGSGYVEEVWVSGAEVACCVLWVKKFFEVGGGGMSMDTLVGEEGDLTLNPGGNGKPVEWVEDGGNNVLMFAHCVMLKNSLNWDKVNK